MTTVTLYHPRTAPTFFSFPAPQRPPWPTTSTTSPSPTPSPSQNRADTSSTPSKVSGVLSVAFHVSCPVAPVRDTRHRSSRGCNPIELALLSRSSVGGIGRLLPFRIGDCAMHEPLAAFDRPRLLSFDQAIGQGSRRLKGSKPPIRQRPSHEPDHS